MVDEKKEEKNISPSDDGVLAQAAKAAERLEKANEKFESLLKRQEELAVERTLSGKAAVSSPEKEEESDTDYAKRVLEGKL